MCSYCGETLKIVVTWTNGKRIIYRWCPHCDSIRESGWLPKLREGIFFLDEVYKPNHLPCFK